MNKLVLIGTIALLCTSCSSEVQDEEYCGDYTEFETDPGIPDAPREEAEPLKLQPLDNTSLVEFLSSSKEGWGEAILDGTSLIAASDDEEANLEEFKVWKDGEHYKMQLNSDDEYTIAECGNADNLGDHEVILLTETDIQAGDSFGKMIWIEKTSDDAITISFLDPMNARVSHTKLFGRFCKLYVCHPELTKQVTLVSISVVEGLYGFTFKDSNGTELYFGSNKLDFDLMEGVIFEHQDDGSIFGHYEILVTEPVTITTQIQVLENEMEPGEFYDGDVLLSIEKNN